MTPLEPWIVQCQSPWRILQAESSGMASWECWINAFVGMLESYCSSRWDFNEWFIPAILVHLNVRSLEVLGWNIPIGQDKFICLELKRDSLCSMIWKYCQTSYFRLWVCSLCKEWGLLEIVSGTICAVCIYIYIYLDFTYHIYYMHVHTMLSLSVLIIIYAIPSRVWLPQVYLNLLFICFICFICHTYF